MALILCRCFFFVLPVGSLSRARLFVCVYATVCCIFVRTCTQGLAETEDLSGDEERNEGAVLAQKGSENEVGTAVLLPPPLPSLS